MNDNGALPKRVMKVNLVNLYDDDEVYEKCLIIRKVLGYNRNQYRVSLQYLMNTMLAILKLLLMGRVKYKYHYQINTILHHVLSLEPI